MKKNNSFISNTFNGRSVPRGRWIGPRGYFMKKWIRKKNFISKYRYLVLRSLPNNIFTKLQFCFRLGWVRSKPEARLFWPTRPYSGKFLENLSQPIVLNIFSSQPDPSLPLGTSRYTYLNQAQFFLENVVFSETVYLFLCNITCLLCLRSRGGYAVVLLHRKLLWFFFWV